jgi:pyruvate/2-oxoglutarate dehydrogenase complex dihydrolipoamide dehydrogenase (E3) component
MSSWWEPGQLARCSPGGWPARATRWPLSSRSSSTIPGRLLVLGGGVVGVELAQAYATLGSRVTVIEAERRLLPREEPFAGEELRQALTSQGVYVRTGVRAAAAGRDGPQVTVTLSDGQQIRGEEILVALGRRPRTWDLGLETVGLRPGQPIAVTDQLAVPGLPWLYAIGDVNGRSLLTHMGKYQAHVVAEILDGHPAVISGDDASAPRVVFTDPQVAAAGLTLHAALNQGLDARAYDVPSSATAGAAFHGTGTQGTARIVVDERQGVIVGATFTGTEVADWLQAATIAIVSKTPVELLWQAVPAFPTRSEIWLKLLERREAGLAGAARQIPAERPATTRPAQPARRWQEPVATAQR